MGFLNREKAHASIQLRERRHWHHELQTAMPSVMMPSSWGRKLRVTLIACLVVASFCLVVAAAEAAAEAAAAPAVNFPRVREKTRRRTGMSGKGVWFSIISFATAVGWVATSERETVRSGGLWGQAGRIAKTVEKKKDATEGGVVRVARERRWRWRRSAPAAGADLPLPLPLLVLVQLPPALRCCRRGCEDQHPPAPRNRLTLLRAASAAGRCTSPGRPRASRSSATACWA